MLRHIYHIVRRFSSSKLEKLRMNEAKLERLRRNEIWDTRPQATTFMTKHRLKLHNHVQLLIVAGDIASAFEAVRFSILQTPTTKKVVDSTTVYTCNSVLQAFNRAKRFDDALFSHDFFVQSGIVSNLMTYNIVMFSLCESNNVDKAMEIYHDLVRKATFYSTPSASTYAILTKGLIDASRIDEALSLLNEMLEKGYFADSMVFNNLIVGFLDLGQYEKAYELFEQLKHYCKVHEEKNIKKGVPVYDGLPHYSFMDSFFNQAKPKEAMDFYLDLRSMRYLKLPSVENLILQILFKNGKTREGWELFHGMLGEYTPPTSMSIDADTIKIAVNQYFKESNLNKAMEVFSLCGKEVDSEVFYPDVDSFNNMIERFCELQRFDEAEKYKNLLKKMGEPNKKWIPKPDFHTYRILIEAYINVGRTGDVLKNYAEMVDVEWRVIPCYANQWFKYLIQNNKVRDCLTIILKMTSIQSEPNIHSIPKPDPTTYEIVIRGLIEYSDLDGTKMLLENMMQHGIPLGDSLRSFVLNAFDKKGRSDEVTNI